MSKRILRIRDRESKKEAYKVVVVLAHHIEQKQHTEIAPCFAERYHIFRHNHCKKWCKPTVDQELPLVETYGTTSVL
jgi:hypothetical protein